MSPSVPLDKIRRQPKPKRGKFAVSKRAFVSKIVTVDILSHLPNSKAAIHCEDKPRPKKLSGLAPSVNSRRMTRLRNKLQKTTRIGA